MNIELKICLLLFLSVIPPKARGQDESFQHVISSASQSRNDVEWRASASKITPE